MRRCLQQGLVQGADPNGAALFTDPCSNPPYSPLSNPDGGAQTNAVPGSCTTPVCINAGVPGQNGTTCTNIVSSIINGHAPCNTAMGFCNLGDAALQCFGQAIGNAWGQFIYGRGCRGPVLPIGVWNTIVQSWTCGVDGSRSICAGYISGCIQQAQQLYANVRPPKFRTALMGVATVMCAASCPVGIGKKKATVALK